MNMITNAFFTLMEDLSNYIFPMYLTDAEVYDFMQMMYMGGEL